MATALGGFKAIAPVPSASDFVDIALSSTQRKLPTVIHKNFKISRIRNFYMRKVKYCANTIDERIGKILTEFPILENLHPFLMHFLNILYDKEHWKIALGQLNKARHLVDQVAKDYLRLLKFADSLYRAKQLKRAALGRMATILKGQKNALEFLEQVRQHLNRLPAIDPNTRTLIICGFPNVGKSSFMNKVTRADVETAPYPFTTKALHVGHTDYKYLRWQIIDTPGILDHDIKDMNVIEMQSITALAHLRAACMYFMDLSEQCGYTIEAQCKLFQSIQPLFRDKPVIVVFNKVDIARYSDLTDENKAFVDEILAQPGIQSVSSSTITEEGVMSVRDAACDALLAHRVEQKMRGSRIDAVANKLHVAVPKQRDTKDRPAFIPPKALEKKKYDKTDPERIRLERDDEVAMSGLGIFTQDMKKNYILDDEEWKYDVMPEFMDGKNVADFFSADIAEQLSKLEEEEERLDGEGFYESGDDEELNSEEEEIADAAAQIVRSKAILKQKSQAKHISRAIIPRKAKNVTLKQFTTGMREIGLDPKHLERRAAVLSEKEKAAYDAYVKRQEAKEAAEGKAPAADGDVEMQDAEGPSGSASRGVSARGPKTNRQFAGMATDAQATKAALLRKFAVREPNRMARASESDRHIPITRPKWMMSGKRKQGTNDRR
ncbi:hypothetical protein QFC21_005642 [Naganishia friedmannii]|uniref:Uncharacterized protein n=1 Tax=Naganishia friedmannii TaxID=89922 RepID=A0ACC2V9F2_9TREE|nr:hypothetical protein QFC21_005642 [Naganishia friedmannii]